jgi:hypothetical protein
MDYDIFVTAFTAPWLPTNQREFTRTFPQPNKDRGLAGFPEYHGRIVDFSRVHKAFVPPYHTLCYGLSKGIWYGVLKLWLSSKLFATTSILFF